MSSSHRRWVSALLAGLLVALVLGPGAASAQDRININTATADELETLPGIGHTKAQAIIDYRTEHGPFTDVEQLNDVTGIGDATMNSIRDLVTVGQGGPAPSQGQGAAPSHGQGAAPSQGQGATPSQESGVQFDDQPAIDLTVEPGSSSGGSDTGHPTQHTDSQPPAQEPPPAQAHPTSEGTPGAAGRININTATEEELQTLPGIGPTTARAIVEYRTANGPFHAVDDLDNVTGIGPATLSSIRDLCTVE